MTSIKVTFYSTPTKVFHYVFTRPKIIDQDWVRLNLVRQESMKLFEHKKIIALTAVMQQEGKREKQLKTFDAPIPVSRHEEYVLEEKDCELVFCWHTVIEVYPSKSKSAESELEFDYYSNVSDRCENILKDINTHHIAKGHVLIDEEGQPVTPQSIIEAKERLFKIYLISIHGNYNNLEIYQLLTLINFNGVTKPMTDSFVTVMEADFRSIDSSPLEQRVFRFSQSFLLNEERKTQWDRLVDETHVTLERLNQCYIPTNTLNEHVRRMIIDQIILPVASFLKIPFCVEKVITPQIVPNQIGWGKVDYCFHNTIIKVVLGSEDEVVKFPADYDALKEELEALTEPNSEGESDEYDDIVEAERNFENRGLAQLSAQLYDIAKIHSLSSVTGVLCTGTTWKYCVLQEDQNDNGKMSLSYEGCRRLSIIRSPAPPLTSTFEKRRRPSAIHGKAHVDRNQVESVMMAFAATMVHSLATKVPFEGIHNYCSILFFSSCHEIFLSYLG